MHQSWRDNGGSVHRSRGPVSPGSCWPCCRTETRQVTRPTSELVLLLMKHVAIIGCRWHAVKEAFGLLSNNCSPIYNLPIVRDLGILIATTGQVCQTYHSFIVLPAVHDKMYLVLCSSSLVVPVYSWCCNVSNWCVNVQPRINCIPGMPVITPGVGICT